MRVPALFLVLVTLAFVVAGCGGPKDSEEQLAAACERQIEEVQGEDEGGTPTAKSTEEKLDQITLIECAGQSTKVVDADVKTGEDEGASDGEDADGTSENGEEEQGSAEAAPVTELDPAARTLFADSCGSCHTLSDAETTGAVGPNLDDTEMNAEEIQSQIENGGGAMPAGILKGEDAAAVAQYVEGAAAK